MFLNGEKKRIQETRDDKERAHNGLDGTREESVGPSPRFQELSPYPSRYLQKFFISITAITIIIEFLVDFF